MRGTGATVAGAAGASELGLGLVVVSESAAGRAWANAGEERPSARPVVASSPAKALQNPRLMEGFPFRGAAGPSPRYEPGGLPRKGALAPAAGLEGLSAVHERCHERLG